MNWRGAENLASVQLWVLYGHCRILVDGHFHPKKDAFFQVFDCPFNNLDMVRDTFHRLRHHFLIGGTRASKFQIDAEKKL
jgi:hypothetical protein